MRRLTLLVLMLVSPLCAAQSMFLSETGTGQVLIFPYYTTNGGNQTIFSITNTTDRTKAVAIKFREGSNGRALLTINVYMPPFDTFAASIFDAANDEFGLLDDGIPGPGIVLPSQACTVPEIYQSRFHPGNDKEFFRLNYLNDGGPTDITRTSEGFFEVIEMGELTNEVVSSADNARLDCQPLINAWSVIGGIPGYWLVDPDTGINPPRGGLTGSAAIVNANSGTLYSFQPVIIENFSTVHLHTEPGSVTPNLSSGNVHSAYVYLDVRTGTQGLRREFNYTNSAEAVSSLLMQDTLHNMFLAAGPINATTEWIVTFPTKQYFTDPEFSVREAPVPPFTKAWTVNADTALTAANETVGYTLANAKGDSISHGDQAECFTICPPVIRTLETTLRYQTNIIRFSGAQGGLDSSTSGILASTRLSTINLTDSGGFGTPLFDSSASSYSGSLTLQLGFGTSSSIRLDQNAILGLPATGFAIQRYTNNSLVNGSVKANYGASHPHSGRRSEWE